MPKQPHQVSISTLKTAIRGLLFLAASLSLTTLGGCSGGTDAKLGEENAQLRVKVDALQSENQKLQAEIAGLQSKASQSQSASPVASASPAPSVPPESKPDAGASAKSAAFTDIAGIEGEQAVKDLAALGILDAKSGKFNPDQPISRAQYVCWLLSANNNYFSDQPNNYIHLARESDPPTFVDVAASHPAYKWIQGMANAGFVVGVDLKHFAPDQVLTREQMVGIKAQVDEGKPVETDPGLRQFIDFSDKKDIDNVYLGAVHEDFSVRTANNISRVWGKSKIFHPKKPVTRMEAAITISKIGSGSFRNSSAADALKKIADK
jgi:outer membrane murein-binding lipoprotein Lpp